MIGDAEVCTRLFRLFHTDLLSIDEKGDRRCTRIDLHVGFLTVAAGIAPGAPGHGELPAGEGGLFLFIHGVYGDSRSLFKVKGHAGIVDLGRLHAGHIDAPAAPADPVLGDICLIICKLRTAVAAFAGIIPPGPDKVADQLRHIFGGLPEIIGVADQCFRPEDQAVRVLSGILAVAPVAVIVAGDIHRGKRVSCLPVAHGEGCAELHEIAAEFCGQHIVELGSDMLFLRLLTAGVFRCLLCGFGLLLCLFVAVYAKAGRGKEVKEDIDAAGHGAGCVEGMQVFGERLLQRDAFGLGCLGDFIAGGVHDDAGMIEILFHHVQHVLLPPVGYIAGIVVLRLVHVPAVDIFVHHQHAEPVTGLQQIFGAGIVCGADRIVAGFLKNADAALFHLGIGARAQNAIVMMNAGAADDEAPAVDGNAFFACPGERADAEGFLCEVVSKANACSIQVRRIHIPDLCIRDFEFKIACAVGTGHSGMPVKNLQIDIARDGGLHLHADSGRMNGQGFDAYAVDRDMLFRAGPEPDRTENAGAGIPAGVGLICVAGNDPQLIFALAQGAVQRHIEIGIAVGALGNLLTVEIDLGVMVNAFKLQSQCLSLLLVCERKSFPVFIVAAFKPADIALAKAGADPRLCAHGVVRQRHRDRRAARLE